MNTIKLKIQHSKLLIQNYHKKEVLKRYQIIKNYLLIDLDIKLQKLKKDLQFI